jgi:hypothetical protein
MDQKSAESIDLWNLGKSQEAADIWMDLAELGHLDSIHRIYEIFFNQRDFETAQTYLSYASNQNDSLILYLKARIVEEIEGFEEAIPIFKSATSAGNDQACLRLINASIEKGDLVDAQSHINLLKEYSEKSADPGPYVLSLIDAKQREIDYLKPKQSSEKSSESNSDLGEEDSQVDILFDIYSSPSLSKIQAVEYLDKHERCFDDQILDLCELCEQLDGKLDVLRVLASNPALDDSVQMRVLRESMKWQERIIGVMWDFVENPNISDEVKKYILGEEAELNDFDGSDGIIEEIASIARNNPRISKKEIEDFLNIYAD